MNQILSTAKNKKEKTSMFKNKPVMVFAIAIIIFGIAIIVISSINYVSKSKEKNKVVAEPEVLIEQIDNYVKVTVKHEGRTR